MTRNILILLAFILVAATPVWTPLVTDSTITGIGTSDSPLKIDTTKIATRYYSGSLTGGGASYDVYSALLTQNGYGLSRPYTVYKDSDDAIGVSTYSDYSGTGSNDVLNGTAYIEIRVYP